jgi:ankyrin repeat protein
MREHTQAGLARVFLLTLLIAAPGEAAYSDLSLVEAARNRDEQQVRALLNRHADVNERSQDGATAILWAAHWNDLETARLLIGAGANVNAANDFRVTPLSLACTNGSAPLVDLLLKAGANPNSRIATGEPPVMTCASSGSPEAVRMLAVYGADVNARQPSQNQTALMWAAAERHPGVVAVLLEAGADPRAHTRKGFTALHFAAREGDLESSRLLLAAGVDVNIPSRPDQGEQARGASDDGGGGVGMRPFDDGSAGSTPLLVATVRGHVPLAIFLLEQGADPNIGSAGFTSLHWAAGTWESGVANPLQGFVDPMSGIPDRQAKLQLVRTLLSRGADPNARMTKRAPGFAGGYTDTVGATPFLLASAAADMEMMRLLLTAGADPASVTATHATAIMAAAGLNHSHADSPVTQEQAMEAITMLLDLGIDPKAVTSSGENALFGPAYRGWNTLLEMLINKGANVNAVSKGGITPWLAASGLGDRVGGVLFNPDTAALLVRYGADPKLGKPCQAQGRCR